MKHFDVIIMNPPYQADKNRKTKAKTGMCGAKLWIDFVKLSLDLVNENGYICNIHPGAWRKPGHELFHLLTSKHILYLFMHDIKEGQATFNVGTGYDWYVLQNTNAGEKIARIRDVTGHKQDIDLTGWNFIPCSDFSVIEKLLPVEQQACKVLFNRSMYGTDKAWMSETKESQFRHPCVYGLTQNSGLKLWYSSKKGKYIGVPKVIIPLSKYTDCVVDYEGQYGICQFAFGIEIESKEEAEAIARVLKSEAFAQVWRAIEWAYNGKEWRVFQYFRRDFWKEFV